MGAAATAVGICIALAIWTGPGRAAPHSCPGDPLISVEAESPDDAAAVCAAVARARPRLDACNLHQAQPLTIRVLPQITHALTACMAQYHCHDDSISVTAPRALPSILAPDSIWRRITPQALFDSLIVHELVHAFLDQAECSGTPCLADHEYIAFALQIDALEPADQAAILDGNGIDDPDNTGRLNGFIARMDPGYFAQAAWLHFSQPDNGCAFVGDLVRGKRTLWVDPY
ncbi:DUF6639 family protein [Rhodovulum marinum]|uniref:Uncharacterized protein n=1 Tax=Rhodovulum marinum TaxID=320662 RepID=A0A4R2PZM0_9RHOB|nr:DUF6639 family protein [Rhodovulum marinum]TCP40834.1 hypothetical protein EV662_10647 [Rhodovulum marinum]